MQSDNEAFASAMLLELFDGDRPAVAELLDVARREIERDLYRMEAARTLGDAKALAAAAHSLKGASANIGSRRIADLSATIERAALAGDTQSEPPELQHLRNQLFAAIEAFAAASR